MPSNLASTAVSLRCRCGATLRAPAHLGGKRLACPRCKAPLRIPSTPQLPAVLTRICAGCQRLMADDAVVCTGCGLDTRMGPAEASSVSAQACPACGEGPLELAIGDAALGRQTFGLIGWLLQSAVQARYVCRACGAPSAARELPSDVRRRLWMARGGLLAAGLALIPLVLALLRWAGDAPEAPRLRRDVPIAAGASGASSSPRRMGTRRGAGTPTLYIDNVSPQTLTATLDGRSLRVAPWSVERLPLADGASCALELRAEGRPDWQRRWRASDGRTYIADPSRRGRWVSWKRTYASLRSGSLGDYGDDRATHGGDADWIEIRRPIDIHLGQTIPASLRSHGTHSEVRHVLRKRVPEPLPAALIPVLLDPDRALEHARNYGGQYLVAALEAAAARKLPIARERVLAELASAASAGSRGSAAPFERIVIAHADAGWARGLARLIADHPAPQRLSGKLLATFARIAPAADLASVLGRLSSPQRAGLLALAARRSYADGRMLALACLEDDALRDRALSLLARPELSTDAEAGRRALAALDQGADPGLRLRVLALLATADGAPASLRARLLDAMVHGRPSSRPLKAVLASATPALYAELAAAHGRFGAGARYALAAALEERERTRADGPTTAWPLLVVLASDPDRSVRRRVARLLAQPRWWAVGACREALLAAAGRPRSTLSLSAYLGPLIAAAQQAPAGTRLSRLTALLPLADTRQVETILAAADGMDGLPGALRAVFPALRTDGQRVAVIRRLAGGPVARPQTQAAYLRLLRDPVPAIRAAAFERLLGVQSRRDGLADPLTRAAAVERDPGVAARMAERLAPLLRSRQRAAERARERAALDAARAELRRLAPLLKAGDRDARRRVHELLGHATLSIAREAVSLLRRTSQAIDLVALERAFGRVSDASRRAAIVDLARRRTDAAGAIRIYQAAARDRSRSVKRAGYDAMAYLSRKHPRVKAALIATLASETDAAVSRRYRRYVD